MGKIVGIVLCIIGLVIWGVDYFIFTTTATGALTPLIAIPGCAFLAVQTIEWVMVLLLVVGFIAIYIGLKMVCKLIV